MYANRRNFSALKEIGPRNTMVTSDFRPEVEIQPFRACAMHPAIIIGTLRSLWTWLWGRYHVPQNIFLVTHSFTAGSQCRRNSLNDPPRPPVLQQLALNFLATFFSRHPWHDIFIDILQNSKWLGWTTTPQARTLFPDQFQIPDFSRLSRVYHPGGHCTWSSSFFWRSRSASASEMILSSFRCSISSASRWALLSEAECFILVNSIFKPSLSFSTLWCSRCSLTRAVSLVEISSLSWSIWWFMIFSLRFISVISS